MGDDAIKRMTLHGHSVAYREASRTYNATKVLQSSHGD
jgi:hypothetical protein